jgi:hypothetical protein
MDFDAPNNSLDIVVASTFPKTEEVKLHEINQQNSSSGETEESDTEDEVKPSPRRSTRIPKTKAIQKVSRAVVANWSDKSDEESDEGESEQEVPP